MDRDAIGRAFRDALHAYRRLRRIAAGRDAHRNHRVAPLAGIGRGSESGPHVHRLGGHARHYHRGLDASAGSAEFSRRRVGAVPEIFTAARMPSARSRKPDFILRIAACSIRARRSTRAPTMATRPSWCSLSSRRTIRWSRGWRARWNAAPISAARFRRMRQRPAPTPRRLTKASAGAWRQAFLNAPYLSRHRYRDGHGERHLRDRYHLGSLRGFSSPVMETRARRDRASLRQRHRHVPFHARLSRRAGAVLHDSRAGQARLANSSNGTRSRRRYPTS